MSPQYSVRDPATPGALCVIELEKNGPCRPAVVVRVGAKGRALEVRTRDGRKAWGRDGSGWWGLWLTPGLPHSSEDFLALSDFDHRTTANDTLRPLSTWKP
jgi:hypothetical protein